MTAYDEDILTRDDAILVTDEIASHINAKVGDTIYLKCWTSVSETDQEEDFQYHFDTDKEYPFVIGAIYKNNQMVTYAAIIQNDVLRRIISDNYSDRYKDEQREVWLNNELGTVYVKFADREQGFKELDSYVPTEMILYEEYGDEWKTHISELHYESYDAYESEQLDMHSKYCRTRQSQIVATEKMMILNTKAIVFYTILITVAVSLIGIGNNYKRLKLNRKSIGVLVSAGMHPRKVFVYVSVISFLEQMLILLITYLIFTAESLLFGTPSAAETVTWEVTKGTYTPLVIAAIVSSVVAGIFSVIMISKKKLLEALSAEA